jgi:hypothetical protein
MSIQQSVNNWYVLDRVIGVVLAQDLEYRVAIDLVDVLAEQEGCFSRYVCTARLDVVDNILAKKNVC